MSHRQDMSRVQRELLELREKGLASSQKDKYKDLTVPLTTPEEAKAFLASMRDKIKASNGGAPTNLSSDGMDAWYRQQKDREKEMRQRRSEAEALLRGYRMTMSQHRNSNHQRDTSSKVSLSPVKSRLFDKTANMTSIDETMEDPDNSDAYYRTVGKLKINDPANDDNDEEEGNTPQDDAKKKKKKWSRPEAPLDSSSSKQQQPVPTPAKPMVPNETEWREFVEPVAEAPFPAEKGRYRLYASYACPGSHRALIVRALKGLEDCVPVTMLHPVWRLTEKGTDKEQRGWVFGNPEGEEFANTAGKGGPFPPTYPGNEPDPVLGAFSLRELYEHAKDTSGKYTVPMLWDTKKSTIVNNESSDISYMLNSSFNEFSSDPDLDLYTEEDSDKLNDVIEWLSPLMIHGVYRCGFAKSQESYDKAVSELTEAFDRAASTLEKQRFLSGNTLTDADIRLFVSLVRYDEVFAFYFKANTRLVLLTPSLLNYCREIYQMKGVADTCNMEQIKAHFYASHAEWNKFSIIPKGLDFLKLLEQPHNRDELGKDEE